MLRTNLSIFEEANQYNVHWQSAQNNDQGQGQDQYQGQIQGLGQGSGGSGSAHLVNSLNYSSCSSSEEISVALSLQCAFIELHRLLIMLPFTDALRLLFKETKKQDENASNRKRDLNLLRATIDKLSRPHEHAYYRQSKKRALICSLQLRYFLDTLEGYSALYSNIENKSLSSVASLAPITSLSMLSSIPGDKVEAKIRTNRTNEDLQKRSESENLSNLSNFSNLSNSSIQQFLTHEKITMTHVVENIKKILTSKDTSMVAATVKNKTSVQKPEQVSVQKSEHKSEKETLLLKNQQEKVQEDFFLTVKSRLEASLQPKLFGKQVFTIEADSLMVIPQFLPKSFLEDINKKDSIHKKAKEYKTKKTKSQEEKQTQKQKSQAQEQSQAQSQTQVQKQEQTKSTKSTKENIHNTDEKTTKEKEKKETSEQDKEQDQEQEQESDTDVDIITPAAAKVTKVIGNGVRAVINKVSGAKYLFDFLWVDNEKGNEKSSGVVALQEKDKDKNKYKDSKHDMDNKNKHLELEESIGFDDGSTSESESSDASDVSVASDEESKKNLNHANRARQKGDRHYQYYLNNPRLRVKGFDIIYYNDDLSRRTESLSPDGILDGLDSVPNIKLIPTITSKTSKLFYFSQVINFLHHTYYKQASIKIYPLSSSSSSASASALSSLHSSRTHALHSSSNRSQPLQATLVAPSVASVPTTSVAATTATTKIPSAPDIDIKKYLIDLDCVALSSKLKREGWVMASHLVPFESIIRAPANSQEKCIYTFLTLVLLVQSQANHLFNRANMYYNKNDLVQSYLCLQHALLLISDLTLLYVRSVEYHKMHSNLSFVNFLLKQEAIYNYKKEEINAIQQNTLQRKKIIESVLAGQIEQSEQSVQLEQSVQEQPLKHLHLKTKPTKLTKPTAVTQVALDGDGKFVESSKLSLSMSLSSSVDVEEERESKEFKLNLHKLSKSPQTKPPFSLHSSSLKPSSAPSMQSLQSLHSLQPLQPLQLPSSLQQHLQQAEHNKRIRRYVYLYPIVQSPNKIYTGMITYFPSLVNWYSVCKVLNTNYILVEEAKHYKEHEKKIKKMKRRQQLQQLHQLQQMQQMQQLQLQQGQQGQEGQDPEQEQQEQKEQEQETKSKVDSEVKYESEALQSETPNNNHNPPNIHDINISFPFPFLHTYSNITPSTPNTKVISAHSKYEMIWPCAADWTTPEQVIKTIEDFIPVTPVAWKMFQHVSMLLRHVSGHIIPPTFLDCVL